jgi:periplasmic protein TonB
MRKVYQKEKKVTAIAMAVFLGVGVTAVLFAILPFSHVIAKPRSLVQLRSINAADLPPPVENEPPPVVTEPEKKDEPPPELKLTEAPQQIALSADLEVAVGSGGALAGFGEVQKLAASETAHEQAFDVSELEKRPEPVSQVAPAYPRELQRAKVEGIVTLVFLLTEDGRVEDARVENSSRPEFEKPALEAIRKWRFRPGMKEGQPVRTYIRIPMRFRVTSG